MWRHQGLQTVKSRYLPEHSLEPKALVLCTGAHPQREAAARSGPAAALIITDAHGETEEVEGAGLVGATPWLPPTAAFEYTSYCPLNTPTGVMHGTLLCTRDDGSEFKVHIPPFDLLSADTFLN